MKVNYKSIQVLYRAGKITIDGVRDALNRGWITADEFTKITGLEK